MCCSSFHYYSSIYQFRLHFPVIENSVEFAPAGAHISRDYPALADW